MNRDQERGPGRRGAGRRARRRGRPAWLLTLLFAPAPAAVAQDGPLRAALAALGSEPSLASPAAVVLEPRTLCEPRRCGLVRPAEDLPARSGGGTIALGAALGAGLGASLGHASAPGPRPAIEAFGWGDAALLGAAGLAAALHGWPHREPGESGRGRISDCAGSRDGLNGVDRFWRRALAGRPADNGTDLQAHLRRRERLNHASDLALHATWAQPLAFLAAGGAPDQWRDVLVHVEAFAVAGALTEIGKHTFHRPRPFAHFCEPRDADALGADDARLSFFSGHTATAFATASAGWRLARMRGYRHAGWLQGSGIALATTTGVLRMAADKHYFTDVLVGAAVGLSAGFLVTKLHQPERAAPVGATAVDGAVAVRAAFATQALYALPLRPGARPAAGGMALQLGVVGGGPALALQWGF